VLVIGMRFGWIAKSMPKTWLWTNFSLCGSNSTGFDVNPYAVRTYGEKIARNCHFGRRSKWCAKGYENR
jgi:hypothetical protein